VLFLLLSIQHARTIASSLAHRIIPVQLLSNPTVLMLFACCAAGGASAFIPIYFLPTYIQFTTSATALQAGVHLLPLVVVMVVLIILNGALMSKLGYYTPWFTLGGLLAMAGAALMYTVRLDTSESRIYGYTVLLGAGVGMWLQAPFSVAQAVVAPEDVPAAVGFMMLAQFAGITFALAIANTVFLNNA
jgi:Na+/melibiose symporter-like transporter